MANIKELEKIFKALANKRRLEIITHLTKQREASVGAIADRINLSFKATSKHLVLLAHAGIVDRDQRDLMMFYRLAKPFPKYVAQIIAVL